MVSIIIPTYNRAGILEETLQSVQNQTSSQWECLVIDDGSTDETAKVMESWKNKDARFTYLERPENRLKGPSSCRNIGAEHAKGDYLLFLDSDDLLVPTCIANRLEKTHKFPDKDFWIFPMSSYIDSPKLKDFTIYESFTATDFLTGFITMEFPWNVTAPLYSTSFFLKLKGFSEDIQLFEDPELAVRAIVASKENFKFINQSDAFYKVVPVSEIKPTNLTHYISYYKKVTKIIKTSAVTPAPAVFKKVFFKVLRSIHVTKQNRILLSELEQLLLKKETLSKEEQKGVKLLKLLQQRYYKKPGYYTLKRFINTRYFL